MRKIHAKITIRKLRYRKNRNQKTTQVPVSINDGIPYSILSAFHLPVDLPTLDQNIQ